MKAHHDPSTLNPKAGKLTPQNYRKPWSVSDSLCTISVLPLPLARDRFLPQFSPEDNVAELLLRGLTTIACLAMDLT